MKKLTAIAIVGVVAVLAGAIYFGMSREPAPPKVELATPENTHGAKPIGVSGVHGAPGGSLPSGKG